MSVSESELRGWLHSEIFQRIPLNIAVIDRDYNVVEANGKFEGYFGSWHNRKCHEVYKALGSRCPNCVAMQTFADGQEHIREEEGQDLMGNIAYYVVHTVPVTGPDGSVTHVIEMSQNVTDIHQQRREYQILFERAPCYIAILDRDFNILRANEKLRRTFGDCQGKHCYEVYKKSDMACSECPAMLTLQDGKEHTATHVGISKDGVETHYVVTTSPLLNEGRQGGQVMEILTDITHLKALEKEMLEAERLAAVGQTVAGLAHSVKNILMGIEGGMYMMGSGLKREDKDRISEGWEVLDRNIAKVSSLVKSFLNFAKGRRPELRPVEPDILVDEIVSLYRDTARGIGIRLVRGERQPVPAVPLDADGIETCLTNLVSNAIDACRTSAKEDRQVRIDVEEEGGMIVFRVSDNGCGMEYDVKQRVFTTFFTTKGGEGTGLGLLTTRKIVQEHGGKIHVDSSPEQGSVFRIEFSRSRLEEIHRNES